MKHFTLFQKIIHLTSGFILIRKNEFRLETVNQCERKKKHDVSSCGDNKTKEEIYLKKY